MSTVLDGHEPQRGKDSLRGLAVELEGGGGRSPAGGKENQPSGDLNCS